MIDVATQSAVNTLRNWRMRREANGKSVTAEDVRARIDELWPGTDATEAARIIDGVMK